MSNEFSLHKKLNKKLEDKEMYEYKVLVLKVKECEETFNKFAKEGWRLVAMVPNNAVGYGIVATLERKLSNTSAGI